MAATTWTSALVTGASSGIGEEFARRLAAQGTDVVLVARRRDELERLAAELQERDGVRAEAVAADLATEDGVDAVAARCGEVELLVNNAGFGISARVVDVDPALIDGMIAVNVRAVALLARAAVPAMIERGRGGIVNVSSIAGLAPSPSFATYNATKAFVTTFTESLALEVAGTGVRVQALCPGLTRTGFQSVAGETGADGIPEMMWQGAGDVVAASLAGLQRNAVIVTPGVHNKVFAAGATVMPRPLLRSIAGAVMRRRGR